MQIRNKKLVPGSRFRFSVPDSQFPMLISSFHIYLAVFIIEGKKRCCFLY